MKSNVIGLDIDENIIRDAVDKTVSAAIAETFRDEDVASQIVRSVLDVKVDRSGNIATSSYERGRGMTWLEYIARKMINDEVTAMLGEQIQSMRPKLRELISSELSKKAVQGKMVDSFIDSMTKSIGCAYRTNVTVSFDKDED